MDRQIPPDSSGTVLVLNFLVGVVGAVEVDEEGAMHEVEAELRLTQQQADKPQ